MTRMRGRRKEEKLKLEGRNRGMINGMIISANNKMNLSLIDR